MKLAELEKVDPAGARERKAYLAMKSAGRKLKALMPFGLEYEEAERVWREARDFYLDTNFDMMHLTEEK